MKVSIITVCYNSEGTIRDTIESVLTQDYADIEHIIIDGGSTDATLSILYEYENKIAMIISEPDNGIYDAMNKGIGCSSGELIGILNSDDYYDSNDVISDIVNTFHAFPPIDIAFGDIVYVNPMDTNTIVRHYSSRYFKPWKLRFGWMPPHPATFIRKQTYTSAGLYSLNFKISADYEMFVRLLLLHKIKYRRISRVLVRMRLGGISTSGLKSSFLLNSEIVKACKANGFYTNHFMLIIKVPFKLGSISWKNYLAILYSKTCKSLF